MRATAIALVITFAAGTWDLGLATLGTAAVHAQEAANWQRVAEVIPLGTKVKLQTVEGNRLSGTLLRVDDTSVIVKRHTRRPEAAVAIAFDRISNLERDHGGGISWGKAVGIGLGAGAGVILTLFVIALQLD